MVDYKKQRRRRKIKTEMKLSAEEKSSGKMDCTSKDLNFQGMYSSGIYIDCIMHALKSFCDISKFIKLVI